MLVSWTYYCLFRSFETKNRYFWFNFIGNLLGEADYIIKNFEH